MLKIVIHDEEDLELLLEFVEQVARKCPNTSTCGCGC
jgi:hypothetical protein